MKHSTHHLFTILLTLIAVAFLAVPAAQAQPPCTRHLAYIDLVTGGTVDTTGPGGALEILPLNKVTGTTCTARSDWFTAVVRVDLPQNCKRAVVWLDYDGTAEGWSLNIGDSDTNNGFGGDAGTAGGQNAEVEVLDQEINVYNASNNPVDVDQIVKQGIAIRDGALRFTVQDQQLTWGQPYNVISSPDLQQLFSLPQNPGAAEDRVIYVGLNRVVAPLGGPASRTGCGVSKALVMFE